MQWILIIIAVIIALIIVFYLAILFLFLFSFSNRGKPPEYDIINELEWLLGNKKLLNNYKLLEFEENIIWQSMANNINLPWSLDFILKHEDVLFKCWPTARKAKRTRIL